MVKVETGYFSFNRNVLLVKTGLDLSHISDHRIIIFGVGLSSESMMGG